MTRNSGNQTVTLLKTVPARLAASLGVAGGAAGDVLNLPYRDALALVQASCARFGSAARDSAQARTHITQMNVHSV